MDVEETTGAAVRELGSRVRLPPTRIAMVDLMSGGRRLRRRRQVVTGGAGVLGLALVVAVGATLVANRTAPDEDSWSAAGPAAAGAAVRCTVERLPLPDDAKEFDVTAGSPGGRFLVGNVYSDSGSRPLLWDRATVTMLSVSAPSAEAAAVNDGGVVVGRGTRTDGVTFGWAYLGDQMVELPTPAGYDSAEATGINSRGEAVGIAMHDERASVAVVWRALDGRTQAERLAAPGSALAFAISDTGVVVGELEAKGTYVWDPDGRGRQLTAPARTEGGRAGGIRGDWVYGLVVLRQDHTPVPPVVVGSGGPRAETPPLRAALWNLRTGETSDVIDGKVGAVTSAGVAVVNDANGAKLRGADGKSHPLPGLSAGAGSSATAISDSGSLIAGIATDGTGGRQPVRWRC